MRTNAEASSSRSAPIPDPIFMSKPVIDRVGNDTLYQENDMEIDALAGTLNIVGEHALDAIAPSTQPAPPHPNVTFNTSHTSAGTIYNVNSNIQSQVNHHHHGVPTTTASVNPMHSLAPFNDAPVDRISSCFMGRDGDMQVIQSALEPCDGDAPSRYAIWGMPGLGKSQLVLSYANASFRAGIHTHIIWISATTLEKVNQGLAKVLDLTQHTDRSNPDHGARLTATRLCLERSNQHLKWLIVLDDATSATLQFLREHLPRQNSHGSILITTRTLDVAEALTSVAGLQHPVHGLQALSIGQSVELLLKRAGIHSSVAADLDNAQKLVKRIGCLPLAVEQAGSYMKRCGFTGAGRLEILYDQQGLEEVIGWDNGLSAYQERSVLATFTVQLQRLGEIDINLLRLLKMLAFFDPESIPLDLLVLGAGRIANRLAANDVSELSVPLTPKPLQKITKVPASPKPPSISIVSKPTSVDVSQELRPLLDLICARKWLRGALRHFEDLSLARPLYGEKISLHIHDLIQLVLQQSMANDRLATEDVHYALAMALLCEAFEIREDPMSPQSWPECERFVPHLMALAKHASTPSRDFLVMSRQVAWYFFQRGRYGEADALYQQALAGQERQLGAYHMDTLDTVHNLAVLYRNQGRYNEAETLYQRALAGREQQHGADHPGTLLTVNNFGWLYFSQGNYDEAEPLYQRALAGQERQLGANHPDTLRTVNNLANIRVQQGKFEEAETLHQRVLAAREQQLGADHPDTLLTVDNFGWLCFSREKYGEAETLYQRALAGREKQLGVDHPDTLMTVGHLALLCHSQGNYDEAEPLYQRALAGQERQLGADHPNTLTTVNNHALLYHSQGNYDEAELLYQRALAGQERQLGADHPDTLRTVNNLATLRVRQGSFVEAERLFNRAIAGREKAIGIRHPDTIASLEDLAYLHDKQGRLEEAQTMRDKVLERTN